MVAATTIRIPDFQQSRSIVDKDGRPTAEFMRALNTAFKTLVNDANATNAALAAAGIATAAAAAANASAATANASAAAAQVAADTVTADANLANSYVTGVTITATDAGANVTIAVTAHSRVYGDGTTVAVNAGNITGLAYSTKYYIYYDDPTRVGGAVTYFATTSTATAAQAGDRHTVGSVTTPAALGAPVPGFFVYPPGVGLIP